MIGFGICLFGQEFIMILFPKEYELAIYPLIFIIFGVVLQSTTQVTASGISLSKKTYLFSNISWVMAGLNILLNYFLIEHHSEHNRKQHSSHHKFRLIEK